MTKGSLFRKRLYKTTGFLLLVTSSFLGGPVALAKPTLPEMKCSTASFYGKGDGFHGRTTANGEVFNAYELTAAHRSLPFGTVLLVVNPSSNREVRVRINDRGPFIAGRDLDLSYQAFKTIADPRQGIAKVCYLEIADNKTVADNQADGG